MAAVGLGAIYEGLKKIVMMTNDAALGVNRFGYATGLSTKNMQQFGAFAEQMGSSADDAQASIKALQKNALDVRIGKGNASPYIMTGINPFDKPFDQVKKIHEWMIDPANANIDVGYKKMIAEQFGFSESMMNVLMRTDETWKKIADEAYLSDDQLKAMDEFNTSIKTTGNSLKIALADIAVGLAPILKEFQEGLKVDKLLVTPACAVKGGVYLYKNTLQSKYSLLV